MLLFPPQEPVYLIKYIFISLISAFISIKSIILDLIISFLTSWVESLVHSFSVLF